MRRSFFAMVLMAAAAAHAQRYPFVAVPGAPHGIYQIMQDSQSALWLGSIDDVVRFDGNHFYSLRPYGFPKETPNSFAEDSDGGIWIATQGTDVQGGTGPGGIYRYQAGHVSKTFQGDGLSIVAVAPGIMVASVATELSGRPAFGDLILFRKSGGGWIPSKLLDKQADHLTVDHQGNLLFPCPGGWCEISQPSLLAWHGPGGQLEMQRHAGSPLIERVLRDRFGCVWFRAEPFASYQCPKDPQPRPIPANISGMDTSDHLEEASDGSIFMLVRMAFGRPGHFHIATSDNGLPEPIDTAMVAKDGTIWVGADSGLYRFMYPFQLELWEQPGIGTPVSLLRNGKDMFASSGGIWKLDQDRTKWDLLPGTKGFGGIVIGGERNTLFAADSHRMLHIQSDGRVIAKAALPTPLTQGSGLARTNEGAIWLGLDGISKAIERGNQFVIYPEKLPRQSVQDIEYDQQRGILWACDGNDVFYLKNGIWGKIAQEQGLLNLGCGTIGIQGNGDLWIGYIGEAVSWIRQPASGHPEVHNYTQRLNHLVGNRGTSILSFDHRGWLWVGNEVMRVASPDAARAEEWLQLDEQDGLPPFQVDGHSFESDRDGSVWFGTRTGIAHFSPPQDFITSFAQPPAFIAGFSLGRSSANLADSVQTIPRDTDTVAHIGSLQFDRRNALHLRYRLLPEHVAWTNANNFDISLGKPRWGHHILQVQAQLATGLWSPVAGKDFFVPWPFWLSWPALLMFAASGVGLSFTTVQWNKRQRFKRDLSLPDLSTWRVEALSPEAEQLIGAVIDGRFEIGHILSVGGFATVARVRDLSHGGKLCAIKIFHFEFGDRAWIQHRFEQEVAALERLSHPNIVRITGHGTVDSGAPFLVMEFIHGHSLREHLEKGPLPRHQIGAFLRQLASALQSLHRLTIYHRDLKPENLMIRSGADGGEEVVLIDFSIAMVKSPDQTFHGISRVAGTLDYMAPEQVIGYADASTDIYSLAKLLMEMLTGLRWTDLFPEATLDLPEQIRSYFVKNPGIFQEDSVDLIVSALAFDPMRRPKDAGEFAKPIARDLERSAKATTAG